jgi:hypothetical protein
MVVVPRFLHRCDDLVGAVLRATDAGGMGERHPCPRHKRKKCKRAKRQEPSISVRGLEHPRHGSRSCRRRPAIAFFHDIPSQCPTPDVGDAPTPVSDSGRGRRPDIPSRVRCLGGGPGAERRSFPPAGDGECPPSDEKPCLSAPELRFHVRGEVPRQGEGQPSSPSKFLYESCRATTLWGKSPKIRKFPRPLDSAPGNQPIESGPTATQRRPPCTQLKGTGFAIDDRGALAALLAMAFSSWANSWCWSDSPSRKECTVKLTDLVTWPSSPASK